MEHQAGLDVSLELTSVCLVDSQGQVVREAKVASEPEALIRFLGEQDLQLVRAGLEAGPLSQWLYAGLIAAGFETVLLVTRHVKAAFSAKTVKTDPRDARGHCPAAAAWLVSTSPCQIRQCAGSPLAADRPQAHPGQAARHRERHPWRAARVSSQGWDHQPGPVRGTYS